MAIRGDFKVAESNLLNWFLSNPNQVAKPLTDFHFSVNAIDSNPVTIASSTDNCFGGVRYSLDDKVHIKLLVSEEVESHQSFLQAGSPLGNLLSCMEINGIEHFGMQEVKLLERIPPFVAAFNISISLRQSLNDGSDCFHQFTLPDNPNEMFDALEKKLKSASKQDKILDENPSIPIFMRGYKRNPDNPFKSALIQLSSKDVCKSPLPNFGVVKPEVMVLDVYSIAYLAITGLAHGLPSFPVKTVITNETKFCIELWLKEINHEDYLSIDVHPEGGLIRYNAEDMKEQTKDLQAAIKIILDQSQVLTQNLVDMPPDIMRIADVVDMSVFSSQKLSISNDIPWLCIDLMFARLSNSSGYETVNTTQFFTLLGRKLSIKQKHGIYLHTTSQLPYPITLEELIQLSKSEKEYDLHTLAELLKIYPRMFTEVYSAINFLHLLLIPVLTNAYIDGEILKGLSTINPRNNGCAESIFYQCCYTSMQCQDDKKAEQKLAALLAVLFVTFNDIKSIMNVLTDLASGFVSGHFLSVDAVNQYLTDEYEKLNENNN